MLLVDTHTHLYLEDYDEDRPAMVQRALDQDIRFMLLPHIDSRTTGAMADLARQFPASCIPMMGLHPTSVKGNYKEELAFVEKELSEGKFCAIGEVGTDLYWDTSFRHEQELVFSRQIELALHYALPLVIHTRNSLDMAFDIIQKRKAPDLRGVFHCFPGTAEQAQHVVQLGFFLGIGGVVTYKNSLMSKVVEAIPLDHLLLETDAPFLSPHPKRGMRNESAFVYYVAQKIAEIKKIDIEEVARTTSDNAVKLFGLGG